MRSWSCGGSVTCGTAGLICPGSGVVAARLPAFGSSELNAGSCPFEPLVAPFLLATGLLVAVLLPPGQPLSTPSLSVGSHVLMPGWYGPMYELQMSPID